MLTSKERRFIRYWEEQREGGRASYVVLYTVVGTFIVTLILSVFLVLFFQIVFGSIFFWAVCISGFVISILSSIITWNRNEKRLQDIIRREIDADEIRTDRDN